MTTFKKYQGTWHIEGSVEEIQPGATVTVTKRNGSTTTVTVSEIVVTGEGWVLASIVSDGERVSTRERREARAERLDSWAESREARSNASFERADSIASMIPFGQPVLVGHHSESRHRRDLDRIDNGMRAGVEHSRKADTFRTRAETIRAQLDRSIYSDDVDAVEQLRERIAELEAERDIKKAANAAARKGVAPGEWGLSPELQAKALNNFRFWPGGTDVPFPDLKNLTANLNRNRKRLAELEGRAA